MPRRLPENPVEWIEEIRDAILDACDTEPFGILTSHPITEANLFHLAPLICLKFRGRKTRGPDAKRVIEMALANYVSAWFGVPAPAGLRPLLLGCPSRS